MSLFHHTAALAHHTAALAALLGLLASPAALAQETPGAQALEELRGEKPSPRAIENRFFLKEGRFELAPHVGYVPNNPFAVRYVGGAFVAYHFGETFSVAGHVGFSPDLGEGDIKGLVGVLLDRAYNSSSSGNTSEFQQPLDKVGLTAEFGVNYAPIYGKINLVGETVLNFDFYLFGGVALISKNNYAAQYDPAGAATGDVVTLDPLGQETKIGPVIGVGQNYFLSQSLALKIDIRDVFYVDDAPQYDAQVQVTEQRLYNNLTASVGIGIFFPAMKPRLYEF